MIEAIAELLREEGLEIGTIDEAGAWEDPDPNSHARVGFTDIVYATLEIMSGRWKVMAVVHNHRMNSLIASVTFLAGYLGGWDEATSAKWYRTYDLNDSNCFRKLASFVRANLEILTDAAKLLEVEELEHDLIQDGYEPPLPEWMMHCLRERVKELKERPR